MTETTWSVRDAVLAERPRLREVFRLAALSNEGDRAALREHPEGLVWPDEPLDEGRTRVAVDEGGTLVGFHSMYETDGALELEDLFVDPAWMRRGVATALMHDAMAIARARGIRRIEVTANSHVLAFYESVGFVADGEETTPFGSVAARMHLDVPGDS